MLNPQVKECWPSRYQVTKHIATLCQEYTEREISHLQKYNTKVNLVMDAWTPQGMKYKILGGLGFYLTPQFQLRMFVFPFVNISTGSDTETQNDIIIEWLVKKGLQDRCIAITSDNGGGLDTIKLTSSLQSQHYSPNRFPIIFTRCFAHILNLIVSHLFKDCGVTPTSTPPHPSNPDILNGGKLDHLVSAAATTETEDIQDTIGAREDDITMESITQVQECVYKVH
jgi:hypothetical protein